MGLVCSVKANFAFSQYIKINICLFANDFIGMTYCVSFCTRISFRSPTTFGRVNYYCCLTIPEYHNMFYPFVRV